MEQLQLAFGDANRSALFHPARAGGFQIHRDADAHLNPGPPGAIRLNASATPGEGLSQHTAENHIMSEQEYDSSSIKVLKAGRRAQTSRHVHRRHPGWHRLAPMVFEVLDNAIDEALAGHADTIKVIITRQIHLGGRQRPRHSHRHPPKKKAAPLLK